MFINFFYDDNNYVLLDFRLSNVDISIKLKILWTDYFFFNVAFSQLLPFHGHMEYPWLQKTLHLDYLKIRMMTENYNSVFLINILPCDAVSTLIDFYIIHLENPYLVIWSYQQSYQFPGSRDPSNMIQVNFRQLLPLSSVHLQVFPNRCQTLCCCR